MAVSRLDGPGQFEERDFRGAAFVDAKQPLVKGKKELPLPADPGPHVRDGDVALVDPGNKTEGRHRADDMDEAAFPPSPEFPPEIQFQGGPPVGYGPPPGTGFPGGIPGKG